MFGFVLFYLDNVPSIPLFRIPTERDANLNWQKALENQTCSGSPLICIRHFNETDYTISKNGKKFYLKKGVVPNIFIEPGSISAIELSAHENSNNDSEVHVNVSIGPVENDVDTIHDQNRALNAENSDLREQLTSVKCEFSVKEAKLIHENDQLTNQNLHLSRKVKALQHQLSKHKAIEEEVKKENFDLKNQILTDPQSIQVSIIPPIVLKSFMS